MNMWIKKDWGQSLILFDQKLLLAHSLFMQKS
jgi:hypothetical protein